MAAVESGEAPKVDKDKIKAEEFKRKSRHEIRKERELDEARKAGTAPAEVDEEGKDINPHIPQFIVKAPWYLGMEKPTLKHQKAQPEREKNFVDMEKEVVRRGLIKNQSVTKFRKGACENCGAMTHKKKDCLERPRKIGAKFSGQGFVPDEYIVQDLEKSFEGKRDRWVGYDSSRYREVIEDYDKLEMAKAKLRADKLEQDVDEDEEEQEKEEAPKNQASEDEYKVADEEAVDAGQKFDAKKRITVRNLRIREDTAKYLYNLDPNSAYYDPKARSMRENPFATQGKDVTEVPYAGDNFVRYTGEASTISQAQVFAWEATQAGADLHLQSEPTKLAIMKNSVEKRKDELTTEHKQTILEKYGGVEHLEAPPKSLLLAQTETYIEYAQDGSLLKGPKPAIPKSIYEEDIHPNNHKSVWGSFWREGQWGYDCCHSFIKNSYCVGEAGKLPPLPMTLPVAIVDSDEAKAERKRQKKAKKEAKKKREKEEELKKAEKKEKTDSAGDEDDEKAARLAKALEAEERAQKEAERVVAEDERKRKYTSMHETKMPTEEEMEAYRIKRARPDDPMAAFL